MAAQYAAITLEAVRELSFMSEPETIEYEVIQDFPASMFDVGDRFSVYKSTGMIYLVEIDGCSEKHDVRDFPHLFQPVTK